MINFVMSQYTEHDAKQYADIGIENTTYEFGFRELASILLELDLDGNYLDFGCGTGRMFQIIESNTSKSIEIFGLDININMIREAEVATKNPHVTFAISDENIPFTSKFFNVITCANVLDEVSSIDQLRHMANNFYRVLADDGALVIMIGNPEAKKIGANFRTYFYYNPHKDALADGDSLDCVIKDSKIRISDTYWSEKTVIETLEQAGFNVLVRVPQLPLSGDIYWIDESILAPELILVCRKAKTES